MVLIPDVLETASVEISSHLLSDDELHTEDFPFSKFLMHAALRLLSRPLGFRYFERLVRGNKCVSSGYRRMWVRLRLRLLISWLVGVVITLTLVPQPRSILKFIPSTENLIWQNPPAHHQYAAKSHGLSTTVYEIQGLHQTTLARFRSGYLPMTFVQGVKSFLIVFALSLLLLLIFWDTGAFFLGQLFREQDLAYDIL
ncbi:hypothetical protein TNCV_2717511 [Trichonephila clavipes]|nr:hypothetical protein TNCV_2717511 [Trichonephila clavipes]